MIPTDPLNCVGGGGVRRTTCLYCLAEAGCADEYDGLDDSASVTHASECHGPMELLDRLNLMRDTFDGRVAVVTGAARGIGEQVARALAHLGAHAIILDIRESGTTVADQIRGNSRRAEFKQVDLTDLKALESVQQEILETHGRVDILVNNASKLRYQYVAKTPMALWDELHQTTVRASAFLISKFLPVMAENKFGVIANTVAVEGLP